MKNPTKHSSDNKNVLADSIYEQLKERIMEQVFQPGSRLNIDALASELNVSPTPIRESLARLAAERLVTFEAYKGYSVNLPLLPRQVADLMHVRSLIEVDAVRLAAQRIMLPELMLLEKNLNQEAYNSGGSWAAGYKGFNQLDKKFHEMLITAADNPFLLDAYLSLNIHVQLGRFHPYFEDVDRCDTCNEHQAIFTALKNRDSEAAAQAVHSHLHNTEVRVFGFQRQPVSKLTDQKDSISAALESR